jgi:hypothetical protein
LEDEDATLQSAEPVTTAGDVAHDFIFAAVGIVLVIVGLTLAVRAAFRLYSSKALGDVWGSLPLGLAAAACSVAGIVVMAQIGSVDVGREEAILARACGHHGKPVEVEGRDRPPVNGHVRVTVVCGDAYTVDIRFGSLDDYEIYPVSSP